MAGAGLPAETSAMALRIVSSTLWFLAAWSMTAIVAFAAGLPSFLAPVGAVTVAGLVFFDPAGILWHASRPKPLAEDVEESSRLAA